MSINSMSAKSLIIAHHKFISRLFWAFPLYATYCMYALCSDLSCLQTACSWNFGNEGHKSTSQSITESRTTVYYFTASARHISWGVGVSKKWKIHLKRKLWFNFLTRLLWSWATWALQESLSSSMNPEHHRRKSGSSFHVWPRLRPREKWPGACGSLDLSWHVGFSQFQKGGLYNKLQQTVKPSSGVFWHF